MSHESQKRRYELRKRAEAMAATRQRITEAAVALHGSVGPARTTMSAVAERAGVQRHTLYRHFPTEEDLFAACSTHYAEANPWPDVASWAALSNPAERLEAALEALYAYYERTEPMYANIFRDEDLVPAMSVPVAYLRDYLDGAARVLARGRPRRRLVRAAIRHAVDFGTWRSLARDGGVSRAEAVRLMRALVEAA